MKPLRHYNSWLLFFFACSLNAFSGLSIESFQTKNISANNRTNSYTATVQAGDLLVLTAASNKRAGIANISFSSSLGTLTLVDTSVPDANPTSYIGYQAISSNGSASCEVIASASMTAATGLYIIRASPGLVQVLTSNTYVNANANSEADQSLSYSWGGSSVTGLVLEALSSRTSDISSPSNVVSDVNANNLRLINHSSFTNSSYSNSYSFSGGDSNKMTSSGVGIVLIESNIPLPTKVSPYQGTNVLFIAIDDINPLLGCYGDPLAITPKIDSLASNGVTFLNAQCQFAVCGPSRASLMTGLMPEETGVLGFKKMRGKALEPGRSNDVVRANMVTLAQHFRYNGYRTAATGKINDNRCVGSVDVATGLVNEDGPSVDDPASWGEPVDPNNLPTNFFSVSSFAPNSAGWKPSPGKPSVGATNLPDSAFTDGIICDEGLNQLQTLAAGDTQFFLGVGFKKPHLPFVAPQAYWDLFDRNDFVPHPFQEHPLHEVAYSWNYANELSTYDDIITPTNIPVAKQLELIHGYYACISFIDAQVGRLLQELEDQNLHTNTIVVLWGDHGFHLGDHAEWGKHTNLERAARVPLIIYSPFTGIPNAKTPAPANLTDLFPTLCELAGLPLPQQPLNENELATTPASGRNLKGISLVDSMNDPNYSGRTGALTVFRRSGAMGYSYRTERYRYIEWVKGGVVDARELYDYEVDPMETINLAGVPESAALMAQFSISMRHEMDALNLSPSDEATPLLQNSPATNSVSGVPAIMGISVDSNNIQWSTVDGVNYAIRSTTNLLSGSWTTNITGITESPFDISTNTAPRAYFQILLDN